MSVGIQVVEKDASSTCSSQPFVKDGALPKHGYILYLLPDQDI